MDLSHHNDKVDFEVLKQNNISFAYIKSTEGTSLVDKNYKRNVKQAREQHIVSGAYHFYIFSLSGYEQAVHFLQNSEFKTGDLMPALDIETSENNPYVQDSAYLQRLTSEIKIFNNEVYKHLGKQPVIYCNMEMYQLVIKDNFSENMLWIVDINNEPDSEIVKWSLWQYTHNKEIVKNQKFSLNKFRFNRKKFEQLLIQE